MRKSLLRLMLGGLAIVSAVSMANAQTLTQDWSHTDNLPGALDARWGTGFDGKVWTNDKSVQHLIYWDETGKTELQIGTNGTAISVDDAGNILINSGFPNVGSSTAFQILPAGGDALQPLTVTMPANATAGRMDFIGRANGNILSEEGGAIYLTPASSANIAKIFVANGVQVADKSKAITAVVACASDGQAFPIDNNPESDNILARPARTQTAFSYYTDGTPTGYTNVGMNTTAGGDAIVLNGVTYTIEPTGTAYCDGFQIVDRSTNTVVATHDEEFSTKADGTSSNQNALTAEKVDEYTANIYQYVPGQLVAKYTFSLPKPEYPENLYIIGSVTDPSWDPETGIKMENEGDGVYTAQIITISGSDNIGIVSVLDSDWDNVVNKNRWGFATNNAPVTIGEAMPIVKGTGSILIGAIGTFDVTVSLKDMTILVEEIEEPMPETLYVVGNIMEDAAFAPDNGKELIKDADANIYRGEKIRIYSAGAEGYGYFALASELGADENDWYTLNTHRYGPAEKDTEITSGVAAEIGKNGVNSYKVLADTYNFEVNLDNGTIILTKVASGVEKVDDTVAAVAGRGEIRIVGEPQGEIYIYNLTGQTIVAGSNEKSFNVAAGVYLVNIDGQTMKVVVR